MKVSKFLRDASARPSRRRRREPRPDGPKTIIPLPDEAPASPLAADLDAARHRLQRRIPPLAEDE